MPYKFAGNEMGTRGTLWASILLGAFFLNTMVPMASSTISGSAPITADQLHQVAASLQMFVDELPVMPKIFGYTLANGRARPITLKIGMFERKWKFHRDLPETTVFAYGTSQESATVPGPTIEALQNVPTMVTWENYLPDCHILPWDPTVPTAIPKTGGVPAVVHLHGGIHEPQSDGSAFAWFTAGFKETGPAWTRRTYTYPNDQQLPGNLWYHDHALGLTRVNLLAGLIGAYVIRNPAKESPLNLPCDEFDQTLFVFDRSFSTDGSLYMNKTGVYPSIHPQWQPEYFGDTMIVNGKAWPYMKVQRRRYRFRIINASNARYLRLSLSNGLPFTQVASDHSYLRKPVTVTSLLISVSEVADVIIDFTSSSGEIELTNDAPYPYPFGKEIDALMSKVMKFVVMPGNPQLPDKSRIPGRLIAYPKAVIATKFVKRYIVMYEYQTPDGESTHLYINGKRLEDPATETPVSGSTEIWKVINLTPDNHPLHMHLASFQAIEQRELVNPTQFAACMGQLNDAVKCNISSNATGQVVAVPENEKTWKYTVKMAPWHMTTIVVKFGYVHKSGPLEFDATAEPGYVYHCHILDHEDNAMIRPLKLRKAST